MTWWIQEAKVKKDELWSYLGDLRGLTKVNLREEAGGDHDHHQYE